ncbi:MAG: dipeptide epimerase [Elusimicrobia bacterium]|nr:dipeptide epimerase [Elusimicrobiota bacterium]
MPQDQIAEISAWPLDAEMNEPFEIATGSKTAVNNVLVRARLEDGTVGWGEGAPSADGRDQGQAGVLAAVRRAARRLTGGAHGGWRGLLEKIDDALPEQGVARAALGMAVLDAWTRRARLPLKDIFGGAGDRIFSDVTVTIVPPEQALTAARRIMALGVRTIKIKIGRDVEEDLERVLAVDGAGRGLSLMLDANQGYQVSESLKLLKLLKRRGIEPILFEQPVPRDDWEGLAEVSRSGGVPVAADESAASREDALRLAKTKAAQVVNIKLMKGGLLEAWDIALIARAAGMRLMIGGMVESSLAMSCAAHFAAGLGGFDFVDLDTPLWFKRDPMQGVSFAREGVYDLSKVKAGIGTTPGPSLRPRAVPARS